MFKLGYSVGDKWVEHSHPPIYSVQQTASGAEKLIATAPKSDPAVFRALADCLTPPYFLLYVLHTPRGEGDPGRYQSPLVTRDELRAFLTRFDMFLRSDARFDMWIHSSADSATIVWDRHNLIHGYGPTVPMVEALRALGFGSGEPRIPAPHEHHYHAQLDDDARTVLSSFDWSFSLLQPEDEQ